MFALPREPGFLFKAQFVCVFLSEKPDEKIHVGRSCAYVNYSEDRAGSIEAGKRADFAVLDRNLFELPIRAIHQTQVLKTVLNGDAAPPCFQIFHHGYGIFNQILFVS